MMDALFLRVQAPFAAFRWLQAGVFRATSPVIPPSAAWGLLLNIAGIDVRGSLDGAVTQIRSDAPALEIAIGDVGRPGRASLYQQLHTYPVGASGKEMKPRTRGSKYWITPVRRELLVGFDCVIGMRGNKEIAERIPKGLAGDLEGPRYGLPFAGDNNLLFDRIDLLSDHPPTRWYLPVADDDTDPKTSCRLTVAIDRKTSSRTQTLLFAPTAHAMETPPEAGWVWTPRKPA